MGNPFLDDNNNLLVLDTRYIVNPRVIDAIHTLEKTGQQQYHIFVTEPCVTQSQPVKDPIKRNNFPLFSRPPVWEKQREKHQLSSVKSDF